MKHMKTDAGRGEICKEMEKRCQLNTWTNRQCLIRSNLGFVWTKTTALWLIMVGKVRYYLHCRS
jgi:hypothetical protein